MSEWDQGALREMLDNRLRYDELKNAAFDLKFDGDGLAKGDLVRGLIRFLADRQRLDQLIAWLQRNRSDLDLSTVTMPQPATSAPTQALAAAGAEAPGTLVIPKPPVALGPFIGRAQELSDAQTALAATPLLHVAGLAGVGKTAFLQKLLADPALAAAFPDGIAWIEGGRVASADFRLEVGRLFGLSVDPTTVDNIVARYLRDRRVLVVYDHADDDDQLAAAERFAREVAPRVAVTSSQRRGQPFRLVALSPPQPTDAAAIFRAWAAPAFDNASDAALAPVVDAVGGHPLALRLAAALAVTQELSPDELVADLKTQPLGLLDTEDLAAGERGVRRSFGLAFDRLDAATQRVFSLVGLFDAGGATVEAWAAAAGAAPGDHRARLGELIRRSLLDRRGARYQTQPLLYQFALEKLAQAPQAEIAAARGRLVAYWLGWLTASEGGDPALAAEVGNLQRGVDLAVEDQNGEAVWGLASALQEFLRRTGRWLAYQHIWEAARQAMHTLGDTRREAVALNNLGGIALAAGDYATAQPLLTQALALAQQSGDSLLEGNALNNLGQVARGRGEYGAARDAFARSLDMLRAAGDKVGEGTALNNLGEVLLTQGDPAAADTLDQALAARRAVGDQAGEVATLINLARVAHLANDAASASRQLNEALTLTQQIGDRTKEAVILADLGTLAFDADDYAQAREDFVQALAAANSLGDRASEAVIFNKLGRVAYRQADTAAAADYFTKALAVQRQIGDRAGQAMTLNNLGVLARDGGHVAQARDYFRQALALFQALGDNAHAAAVQERLTQLES